MKAGAEQKLISSTVTFYAVVMNKNRTLMVRREGCFCVAGMQARRDEIGLLGDGMVHDSELMHASLSKTVGGIMLGT